MPKSLPEALSRLTLWRNTIYLFHKTTKFIGPFCRAGFEKYRIDSKFLTWQESDERKPDIVSSSDKGTLIVEVTLNPETKNQQLNSYIDIDTQSLGAYGLQPHNTDPDVICSRLDYVDDGCYCEIIVKDKFRVEKSNYIQNNDLKKALLDTQKERLNLTKLPTLSFTLVPEMASKSREIRYGISEGVMQIFSPSCQGKTVAQLVSDGLERIEENVSEYGKKELQKAVSEQMDLLRKRFLSEYLIEKDGIYQKSEKFNDRPNTLGAVTRKLQEWVAVDQATLAKWGEGSSP